jgi:hypothetical protein
MENSSYKLRKYHMKDKSIMEIHEKRTVSRKSTENDYSVIIIRKINT